MYTSVWRKYLPIIKILLKRSANSDQVLDLNRVDFERAGSGRKAGYKFTIELNNGKVRNVISGSPLALNLATVLLEDDANADILSNNHFEITLNTKFQLITKNLNPKQDTAVKEPAEAATD
ncbi:MAG: hypothetical protein ABIX01_17315 [Chitinophagaceae bacterium]